MKHTIQVKRLTTLREKSKGLIGARVAHPVTFRTRFGIHTFGVKFSIDVLILDTKNRVVIAKTVRPNRIFLWNPQYATVVELPPGTIRKKTIKKGDVIKWMPWSAKNLKK